MLSEEDKQKIKDFMTGKSSINPDAEQWKSLSHIRNVAYPTTLGDKIKLLSKMMVI